MKTEHKNNLSAFRRTIVRFSPDCFGLFFLALFGFLSVVRYPLVRGEQDIGVYAAIAQRVMQLMNGAPVNIASEYPPSATVLFWFVHALMPQADFAAAWLLLMMVTAVCAWAYLRCYSVTDAFLFALVLPLSVLLLGHDLLFSRFDFYVAVALLLSWRTHRHGSYGESAAWLSAAVLLKLVPVLVVPFFLLSLPKRAYVKASLGVFFTCLATGVLWYGVLGTDATIANIGYMLSYHGDRAVQLETLWSGAFMLLSVIVGRLPDIGFGSMSVVNFDVPMLVATASKVFILTGVGILFFRARRMRSPQYGLLMLLVMLGALIVSPVLSPQYLVWIVPLLLVYVGEKIMERQLSLSIVTVLLCTLVMSGLTQWVFPSHYPALMGSDWSAILALNVRNASMIVLFLALLFDAGFVRPLSLVSPVRVRPVLARIAVETFFLIAATFMFAFYRPALLTTHTDVTVTYGSQKTVVERLPVSFDAPAKAEMTVRTTLHVGPRSQRRFFKISVDDCLRTVTVNDVQLPDDVHFCGTTSARVFDFGPYLQTGDNLLTLTARNNGAGPMGVGVVPSMTATLFLSVLALVFLVLRYAVCMTRAALLLSQSSPAARFLEMLYTLLARWTTSRFAPTASSIFLPQTPGKLSI